MPLKVRSKGCGSASARHKPGQGCGRCELKSARRCPAARRQVKTEAPHPSRFRARLADNRSRLVRHSALHGDSPGPNSRRRQSKRSARSADPRVAPLVAQPQGAGHRRKEGGLRHGWLVSDGLGACLTQHPGSPRKVLYKPQCCDLAPARVDQRTSKIRSAPQP